MSKGYGFPAASKILSHQDHERALRQHRQKVQDMNAGVDNSEPRRYPHLIVRLKQKQLEMENLTKIKYENELLIKRRKQIFERRGANVDNNSYYSPRSLNKPYKEQQLYRIQRENWDIARRLGQVKPYYNIRQWEDDHKRHLYYLQLWADTTKDYTPRRRKKERDHDDDGDEYESDFEGDDEEEREKHKDRLPPLKNSKKSNPGGRKKSNSQSQTLPKLKDTKVDDKVKVDQAEVDARHLFRVAKVLAPPHDIFIRTLVRRTPGQRSQIKKRFKQLYELDLVDELKKGLGKEWHVLIDALLEKNGEDAGSSAEEQRAKRGPDSYSPAAIHTALQRGDVPTVVQVLVTKTDHKISRLRESYTKEYSVSLEAEISERVPEPERLFLLTLLKRKKDRGKADVHQDAQDLFEYGEGRWTSSSGLFLKLLEERSISHMREVLLTYEQVSSGVSALQAIEQDISPSYAKAVEAFLGPRGGNNQREKSSSGRRRGRGRGQDMDPGGAGSGSRSPSRDGSVGGGGQKEKDYNSSSGHPSAGELATFCYRNLDPSNASFVNTIVRRAETDMRPIRIAYKKKYGKALEVDLEERSRHPTVSILVKLILKSPAKDARKDQHQDSITQRHGVRDGDRKNQNDRQESGHGKGHRERHDEGQGHDLTQGRRDKKAADHKSEDEAKRLHEAMDGLGTNKNTILDILVGKSNVQRQTLKAKYKEMYRKELAEDLKSELGGDLEETVTGLLMPPVEYDAFCLHSSPGASDSVMLGILCTASPKELSLVKEHYKKMYGQDLDAVLSSKDSSGYMELLLGLSDSHPDPGSAVSQREAREDAVKLYRNGQGPIVKDEVFKTLLEKRNKDQIKATLAEYKKLSGRSLEDDVKAVDAGDEQEQYVTLLAALGDHVTFYADSLQNVFREPKSSDSTLVRIVISRSEVDLPAIKAKFQERHGRSLREAIEKETKEDNREALLKILDKK